MSVKHLTILLLAPLFITACGKKVEVREYVEVVQLPARPQAMPPQVAGLPDDPMRAAPLTVAPILENLPPDHPTFEGMHPPMSGGAGPNVMAGRESEVPPPPEVEDLTWQLPPDWTARAGSGMRIAEFVPGHGHEGALVTLIALSGGAGSMDANVSRWRGQIGLSPEGKSDIQQIEGEMPFDFLTLVAESKAAGQDQSIIAAIYHQSDRTLFLKFMGPTEVVADHKIDFLQLAGSLAPKEAGE
jgi:hypothetical protein